LWIIKDATLRFMGRVRVRGKYLKIKRLLTPALFPSPMEEKNQIEPLL